MLSYCHNCCGCASAGIHPISLIHLNIAVHNNHSTHSVGGIEGVVASNKVVSTRKNARSAHVEISKVERFRMRGGRKGERLTARRPQLCHEVKACWSIFMSSQARAWYFLRFQSPPQSVLHPSAVCPLRCMRSTFLHAGTLWHLQGSSQKNEARSGR